ncbi:hypothetical protein [Blastopirellula retiformator]|uniref:Uncharacterized protein n=1 Tax=Blastopirellula retiformator TaxID=2527970 RepID=A0A5C5VL16_9BACT|nr:hypothetical protein [Blastopirellula retiformator]TWT39304.1 hypothetical protein Enr8_10020 [Blastopirellula retiformator]
MKCVEFESQLHDLLDERRFHEVDQLLSQVDAEDRTRCERLAADYAMLFDGLESWDQPTAGPHLTACVIAQLQTTSATLPIAAETPSPATPVTAWLPIAALGMAASLLILAVIPFSLNDQRDDRIGQYGMTALTDDPTWEEPLEPLDWEDAQYVSTVRSPFDLPWDLTNDLVGVTTTAQRLPLDSTTLAVSSLDARPWIDTVQHPFRPLTQSMGSALMVIKEVTIPTSTDRDNLEAKPQARGARLPLPQGRRIT